MVKIPEWLTIVVILILGTILSFALNPVLVWSGIFAMSIGFMLLGSPYWILIFLMGWSMTAFVFQSIFQTKLLSRVDDLLILLVLAVCIGNIVIKRVSAVPYVKLYMTIIGLVLFSKIINGTPLLNMGLFFLAYCAPYLLFCLIYAVNVPDLPKKIVFLVVLVFLFGLMLNLSWMVRINPIFNEHLYIDAFAKGTLGSCSSVAYFSIFMIFLFASIIKNKCGGKKTVLLLCSALFQFFICYTTHAYIYFAACLPLYMVVSKRTVKSYIVVGLLALCVGSAMLMAGSYDVGRKSGLEALTDRQLMEMRWMQFLRQPKADVYYKVIATGYQDGIIPWFIGHGPGSGVGTVARTRPSSYTFKVLGDYYLTHSGKQSMQGSSITQSPWSALASLWSEVGMLGSFLFYLLPLLPARIVFLRLMRGFYGKGGYEIVVAESFIVYLGLFYMINIMDDFWSTDYFVFLLWALAGLALRVPERTAGSDSSQNEVLSEESAL